MKYKYICSAENLLMHSEILERENRSIMAALPHALGDRQTHQSKIGELFWETRGNFVVNQTAHLLTLVVLANHITYNDTFTRNFMYL